MARDEYYDDVDSSILDSEETKQEADEEYSKYLADIKELLKSEHGKRVLVFLLRRSGLFNLVTSSDPIVVAMNNAYKATGSAMITDIKHASPEMLPEIIQNTLI